MVKRYVNRHTPSRERKRQNRPSPSLSAAEQSEGTTSIGNDGNMYIARSAGKSKRWFKLTPHTQHAKRRKQVKRKTTKRKSPKRKTTKRKSPKQKTAKRKTTKRKSSKRKTTKRQYK